MVSVYVDYDTSFTASSNGYLYFSVSNWLSDNHDDHYKIKIEGVSFKWISTYTGNSTPTYTSGTYVIPIGKNQTLTVNNSPSMVYFIPCK